MITEAAVRRALQEVIDPELGKNLVELDMVREIRIDGDHVAVHLALTIPGCPLKNKIRQDVVEKVTELAGAGSVEVIFGAMSDEERASLVEKLRGTGPRKPEFLQPGSKTRVIGIASGKGGVGKSTVTVNLSVALARAGYRVGLMDADIYGFSIPRMLGLRGRPSLLNENTILPMEAYGVRAISAGSLVEEDTPIIWRGPMLGRMLEQFLNDVYWGDLDYFIIDLPPGTGDVALSVVQMMPQSELVLVTTPQAASANVASRVANMAEKTNQTVLGVIENMAWFSCPHCGEPTEIFGRGGAEALAERLGVDVIGRIPLTPQVREGGDEGRPVTIADPESPAARAFLDIAQKLVAMRPAGSRP